jgi:hypothetical protein
LKQVHAAEGMFLTEAYVVNIRLINGVQFINVEVTRAKLPPGTHALIGMDIITPSVDTSKPAINRHRKTGHHAHTTETG